MTKKSFTIIRTFEMHWQFSVFVRLGGFSWVGTWTGTACDAGWVGVGMFLDLGVLLNGGIKGGKMGMASKEWEGWSGLISVRWWTAIWIEVGSCPTGTLSDGLLSWNSYGLQLPLGSDRQHLTLWGWNRQRGSYKVDQCCHYLPAM